MYRVVRTWVELTMILLFHHIAHLPNRFSQIPICPSITRLTVE